MRPLRFRIVALIAAYALVLHALLLAFAPVASANAASHIAGLCVGLDGERSNTPPASHDSSCAAACAMLGGTMAAPAAPVVSIATPILALVLHPAIGQASPRPALDGPPRARAPPLV